MEIKITTDVLLDEMEKYTKFTWDVFNYLNPLISPRNPCQLYISVYNPYNYGEFRKPNIIDIPLGSIINNFAHQDDMIKAVIILSLCHELYHANQLTDMIRYSYDKEYAKAIEDQAEYQAEKFLFDHSTEIYKLFGINPTDIFVSKTEKPNSSYEEFDYESYYINTLADVIYRNSEVVPKIKNIFNRTEEQYKNLCIAFGDNGKFDSILVIRYHWNYIPESLQSFNDEVNRFRVGTACMNYDCTTNILRISENEYNGILKEGGMCILINITNKTYEPIGFF